MCGTMLPPNYWDWITLRSEAESVDRDDLRHADLIRYCGLEPRSGGFGPIDNQFHNSECVLMASLRSQWQGRFRKDLLHRQQRSHVEDADLGHQRSVECIIGLCVGDADLQNVVDIASEALQDGNGAEKADWVMALSQPERRADNIELFVRKWIGHDYNAAATWIGDMDLGAERDAAITVLVQKVAPFDPVGAEVWAQEIGSR